MEPTEAIDILRGTTSPASVLHPQIAADMGAQALAAWEWVERQGNTPSLIDGVWVFYVKPKVCEVHAWIHGEGLTPLAAVLDAMAKEATDAKA